VQYQHLLDALRPLLRQFAAYPRSVNQVGAGLLGSADPTWRALVPRPRREPHPAAHAPFLQSNAHVLPIMLATKLLPEMEAEEQRLLQQLEREQQLSGAAHSGPPAALSIAEQFAWVQDQEQELNHLVDQLARGDASPLGEKRRKEVQAAAARAAAAVAPATPAPGAAMQRGRAQQASPPDPLLAAVAFGAGLA
jgi:hypothetical protein